MSASNLLFLFAAFAVSTVHGQATLTTSTTSNPAAGAAQTSVVIAGESSTSTSSSTTSTASSNIVELSTNNNPADWTDGPSWLHTHWQWVVMIVVLAVGLALAGIIGTIVYKRKSKSRQRGVNNTAPMMRSNPTVNSWAPSRHSVHDFGTPTRGVSPPPPMPPVDESRRQSRRLSKAPATVRTP